MADNVVSSNYIDFSGRVKGNGFQQLNKQIMSSHRNLFSLGNMFSAFFGYDLYSSVRNLIPQLVNTSQQLGAMKSRFNAVSTSASAGADELNWVGEQSKRLGLDFLRTADDYSIFFATVSKNMGQGTTRKVFEQWAEAFRVLHIDPERQTRVLYALREMSSKGKIYMQDLALQLGSAVPDAMNIAAKSMGYTGPKAVERFRAAIKAGTVDVKKFIPLFSEAVNKQYVSQNALNYAMEQTDAQLQLINTHWQFLQKNLLEAGLQEDIVKFLKGTNKLLGFLEKHSKAIIISLKVIFGLVVILMGTTALGGVVKMVGKVGTLVKMLDKLKGLGKVVAILQQLKLGSGAMGVGIGIILKALTNPWILGAVLITGLGIGLAFIIKKFFPNVWSAIAVWWIKFCDGWKRLFDELMESPFMKALTSFFGTEKKGFGKDVQDRQEAWRNITPNHQFIFNLAGFLDAVGKKSFDLGNRFNPMSLGAKAANVESRAIKHFIEQKFKIDIKVDGVEDKKTIMDSVHNAISEFAEKSKKQNMLGIINSKTNNKLPFTPLSDSIS